MTDEDLTPERAHAPVLRFMSAVTRCADTTTAVQTAAELVSELLRAEAGAAVVGRSRAVAGTGALAEVVEADGEVAGCGGHRLVAAWHAGTSGRLVVVRTGEPFTEEDGRLLRTLAEALGMALDLIDELERGARQQLLLGVLLEVQRAISHREPLATILTAITQGAREVLRGWPVTLLLDEDDVSTITGPAVPAGAVTLEVPVHVHGVPSGALVAVPPEGTTPGPVERDLLQAFAEHASLALTEARTFEAMEEAFWDPVTGLPTRQLLVDRLRRTPPDSPGTALLLVHLNRFAAVNDVLGRAAGDELLRLVTERLTACAGPDATVARFGGGEFGFLLTDASPGEAEATARTVVRALEEPFTVLGTLVHVGAAIGVAHRAPHESAEDLLSNADVARFRARAAGSGAVVTYDAQMRAALLDRIELQAHLQTALDRRELVLHYQPIVELDTGRSTGVEALLRWTHPSRGTIPPSDFIPIAEVTGAIVPIGRWVLETACRQVARWRTVDPDLTMNVNVSAHQLRDPGFPEDVRRALEEAGLPGSALILEITESALLEDDEQTLEGLRALKELGVAVALDDFGTGYSALGYLRRFPVDILKIDKSFVSGEGTEEDGDQLVRTIIELGRAYRLEVVAEGIEDEEQRRRLMALGCRVGQGFHFGRPTDDSGIEARLATVHPLVPRPRRRLSPA